MKKAKTKQNKRKHTNYTYMYQKFISLENRFTSGLREDATSFQIMQKKASFDNF